jgi:hypothetical protein
MHSAGVACWPCIPQRRHIEAGSLSSAEWAIGSVGPRLDLVVCRWAASIRSWWDGSARDTHRPLELPNRSGGYQVLTAIIIHPAWNIQGCPCCGGNHDPC